MAVAIQLRSKRVPTPCAVIRTVNKHEVHCGKDRRRSADAYSSDVSPVPRAWNLDWSTASVGLSVAGAALSLFLPGLFWGGVILFVLGLIAGVVALRTGLRRNIAVIGIVLNAANLAFDAFLVILAASRH